MEMNPNFSVNAQNDFILVREAIQGDQKAYNKIMQRYERSVYFLTLKMVGNEDDANDLTVETFAKAFENLHKYKADFAFSSWLFRIATNSSIDFLRKKRLQTVSIDTISNSEGEFNSIQLKSEAPNPEERSIKKQQSEEMRFIIDQLPQYYRKLINLRYYDDLTYEEIAVHLNSPVGTVKVQLFRAKDLISNMLNIRNRKLYSEF